MADQYDKEIERRASEVLEAMSKRTSPADMERLRQAYELAREAHAPQRRKTGEPYIFHPIAVARIAAVELQLDVDSVIAAFLHDVVEDTPHTLAEIQRLFGNDVAFIVGAVTKRKKKEYVMSKQMDNFKQMLDAMGHDVRSILVKLSDRLHNMRTLASMPADKQMKIAGETDYFYAPLATRLGLYNVKTELENLSFKFRCPHEYADLEERIERDRDYQRERLAKFCEQVRTHLAEAGIDVRVYVEYRHPYSLWRKMQKYGDDFNHLKYRHFTEIVFTTPEGMSEKDMTLRLYSLLTDRFKEKPGGISNYIDSPKENGYQSFHLKLLADFGRWQEVHISSERMVLESQIGCMGDTHQDTVRRWIEKFRGVLRDGAYTPPADFIENVISTFYNDDIMTFTPHGRPVVLPQKASVLDFAYEVHTHLGEHAQYARINGFLASIHTQLHRGDVVEVFTSDECHPYPDWLSTVVTYKARRAIGAWLARQPEPAFSRCPVCSPIPGEEVVAFKGDDGRLTLHKRDCPVAIKLASQHGDRIVAYDYAATDELYPVHIFIRSVDRVHLLIDIVSCITETLNLSMYKFKAETVDGIVELHISLGIHSYDELTHIIGHINAIDGVDEVQRLLHVPD